MVSQNAHCLTGQSGGDVHIQDPQSFAENANMALPPAVPARMSIATALGVAAANAKLLADQEEREMESLLADIIDNQVVALPVQAYIPMYSLL